MESAGADLVFLDDKHCLSFPAEIFWKVRGLRFRIKGLRLWFGVQGLGFNVPRRFIALRVQVLNTHIVTHNLYFRNSQVLDYRVLCLKPLLIPKYTYIAPDISICLYIPMYH